MQARMQANDICAVVVTFHPDSAIRDRLNQLRQQVGAVVIVDNGSSPVELLSIEQAIADPGCPATLLKNDENLGIATALNQGIAFARDNRFTLVVLFDQDSQVTGGFSAAMLACFAATPLANRLGILVPRYVDSRLGTALPSQPRGRRTRSRHDLRLHAPGCALRRARHVHR